MTLPTGDSAKHDVILNGVGYMLKAGQSVIRSDANNFTSRAAQGEGRYDTYQTESFVAMADYGGGSGQGRYDAADQYLSGIGDGRFQGHFFPARKKITESDGGTTSWYFVNNGTLYGMTAGFIETIGGAGSQARTAGQIKCRPRTSGNNNTFWVQDATGNKLFKWTGSGSPTDITPSGVTPYLTYPQGRFMWMIGAQSFNADGALVQSAKRKITSNTRGTLTLTSKPKIGNVLIAITGSVGTRTVTPTNATDQWVYIDEIGGATTQARLTMYYRVVTATNQNVVNFTVSASDKEWAIQVAEFSGIDLNSPFVDSVTLEDTTADTSLTFATGLTAGTYGIVVGAAINSAADSTLTGLTNSFAQVDSGQVYDAAGGNYALDMVYRADTSTLTTVGTQSSATDISMSVAFRQSAGTGTVNQTMFYYTQDDGGNWEPVFNIAGAGIPQPSAVHTAGGSAWITTANALYEVKIQEREFEDHVQKVLLSIDDVAHWEVPKDTASVGTWITDWQGQIYWNVGASLWSYAPGAQEGRQAWPTQNWDGIAGEVQSVVAGEGGVYFGSAGYLWCYNERGFFELAKEPAADDFDYIWWHQGRLYFNDDPGSYFYWGYPSSRPDVVDTTATYVDTGYLVTSCIDLEKTNEYKIARQFETHAQFSKTSNSGTITLEYLIADSGLHPEGLGGGATSLTWTSIGTHTVSDTNFKRYTLGTPAEFKKIYLRVTLTPGSSGYPILENIIINGRALMPQVHSITATLAINTMIRDRQGSAPLYPDEATVQEAINALQLLRAPTASPRYFTASFVEKNGTTEDYVVNMAGLTDAVLGFSHADGMSSEATVQLLELP